MWATKDSHIVERQVAFPADYVVLELDDGHAGPQDAVNFGDAGHHVVKQVAQGLQYPLHQCPVVDHLVLVLEVQLSFRILFGHKEKRLPQ